MSIAGPTLLRLSDLRSTMTWPSEDVEFVLTLPSLFRFSWALFSVVLLWVLVALSLIPSFHPMYKIVLRTPIYALTFALLCCELAACA